MNYTFTVSKCQIEIVYLTITYCLYFINDIDFCKFNDAKRFFLRTGQKCLSSFYIIRVIILNAYKM